MFRLDGLHESSKYQSLQDLVKWVNTMRSGSAEQLRTPSFPEQHVPLLDGDNRTFFKVQWQNQEYLVI